MRRELIDLHLRHLREFIERLPKQAIYSDQAPVRAVCRVDDAIVPFARRRDRRGRYRPIQTGEVWGSAWQSAWFHITGRVPAAWRGADVALRFDANGESLVFDDAGCPVYGLTNGSVFASAFSKDIYRIFEPCRGGEAVDLWIEAAAYGLFGINRHGDPRRDAPSGTDTTRDASCRWSSSASRRPPGTTGSIWWSCSISSRRSSPTRRAATS